MTEFPPALAIKAFFGLTTIRGACAEAGYLVLDPSTGQTILSDFEFIPIYEMLARYRECSSDLELALE